MAPAFARSYHRNWDHTTFRKTAEVMKSSGLLKLGYDRVEMDGGWWEGADTGAAVRNASGFLQFTTQRFPGGQAKPTFDYIASLGFKYHWYFDAGEKFCNRDKYASEGFEKQDVALADWLGVSGIKLDACGTKEEPHVLVSRWQKLLNETGRPILFANCRNGCLTQTGWEPWCAELTNQWRTSGDIQESWSRVMFNTDQLVGRGAFGAPHRWNYPDSLETGNLGNAAQDATNFALWCVASSPLIMGHDVPNQTVPIFDIVSNADAIAVNQQYAGNAGDRIDIVQGAVDVWAKPLAEPRGAVAVVAFNRNGSGNITAEIDLSKLPFASHWWSAAHPRRTERGREAVAARLHQAWWTEEGSLAEQARETPTTLPADAVTAASVFNVWTHKKEGTAHGEWSVRLGEFESAFLVLTPQG